MEPEKKLNGALVGVVIIIAILVIGGIYMWQSKMEALEDSQPGAINNQDARELDALDSDTQNINTSTGVDANTVY